MAVSPVYSSFLTEMNNSEAKTYIDSWKSEVNKLLNVIYSSFCVVFFSLTILWCLPVLLCIRPNTETKVLSLCLPECREWISWLKIYLFFVRRLTKQLPMPLCACARAALVLFTFWYFIRPALGSTTLCVRSAVKSRLIYLFYIFSSFSRNRIN